MRYLKQYNELKSEEDFSTRLKKMYKKIDDANEVYKDMQDISQEIKDEGFIVDIRKQGWIIKIVICRSIVDTNIDFEDDILPEYQKPIEFKYSRISDCVDRLVDYGKINGYKFSSSSYQINPYGIWKETKQDDNIYTFILEFMPIDR